MDRIPVSIGELMDKWVILMIKAEKIKDDSKLKNVKTELDILNKIAKEYQEIIGIKTLLADLYDVNSALWIIEDEIRDLEREGVPEDLMNELDGDSSDTHSSDQIRFVELAREVYFTNDKRCAIKRKINELTSSGIVEEKSYKAY